MNNVATPVLSHWKAIAYVIPADDFESYKDWEKSEKLENQELAKIAKASMKSGYASAEETDSLFSDILKIWK